MGVQSRAARVTNECEKLIKVVPVRLSQRGNVHVTPRAVVCEVGSAFPVNGRMAKRFCKKDVSADACVPAIAIREQMDPDKFVVKPGSRFQRCINAMFRPLLRVSQ